jgi:hypothetical protein
VKWDNWELQLNTIREMLTERDASCV